MYNPSTIRRLVAGAVLLILLGACSRSGVSRDIQEPSQSVPARRAASSEDEAVEVPESSERTAPFPGRLASVLAVYGFDALRGELLVRDTLEVSGDSSPAAALESLLARINPTLGKRAIRKSEMEETENPGFLEIDLVDLADPLGPESWYNSFQGSAGGAATQVFLVATFLQKSYAGEWFEEVRFRLNGQRISEMDHVDLSGLFLRSVPLARQVPVPIGEIIEFDDRELGRFLLDALGWPQDTRFILLRPQWEPGGELVVFFASQPTRSVHRGIVRMTSGDPEILSLEEDPCYCGYLEAKAMKLVKDQREFLVTRFSPRGGTCVGSDVVRILSAAEDGSLAVAWQGTSFEGSGSTSQVATIEFVDADGDGNLEILRRTERIDCGEDCLCREGPVLETFQTRYSWNPERGGFVQTP